VSETTPPAPAATPNLSGRRGRPAALGFIYAAVMMNTISMGVIAPVFVLFVVLGVVFLLSVNFRVNFEAREMAQAAATPEQCRYEMLQTVPGLVLAFFVARLGEINGIHNRVGTLSGLNGTVEKGLAAVVDAIG